MKREHVIVAIHGILTGETSRAWQQRFRAYVWRQNPEITILSREYFAGAIPAFNVYVRNPRLAAALVDALESYAYAGAMISIVSHSNGADVAVKTIRQLAAKTGARINTLVCIGAAIQADVQRNGLLAAVEENVLGRAVAYCSASDRLLSLHAKWPYGSLGREGFTRAGRTYVEHPRLIPRWFPGYNHTTYFEAARQEATFAAILQDVTPEFEFADAKRAEINTEVA